MFRKFREGLNKLDKRGKILLISLMALLVIIIVVWIWDIIATIDYQNRNRDTVQILNINNCSRNITDKIKQNIFEVTYGYVNMVNERNGKETKPVYDATLRLESCYQEEHYEGDQKLYYTNVIVDVPDARQSWQVSYLWATTELADEIDLGPIEFSCVAEQNLIYSDFGCNDIPVLKINQEDPIMKLLPFSTFNYRLFAVKAEDGSKTQVTAEITLYSSDTRGSTIEEATNRYKAEIANWFKVNSLNINNYNVTYNVSH